MYSSSRLQDHETSCRLLRWIPARYVVMFICFCISVNSTIVGDLFHQTALAWLVVTDYVPVERTLHCNFTKGPFKTFRIELPRSASYPVSLSSYIRINRIFFVGEMVLQIPVGYLSDKHGARIIILVYGIATAVVVCSCPLLVQVSKGNVPVLIGWRFMLGLLTGLLAPTINGLIANWAPKSKRTTHIGIMNSAFCLGSLISRTLLKLTIVATGIWQTPFYIWAVVTGLCTIVWYFLGYSSPSTNPYISFEEKRFFSKKLGKSIVPFGKKNVPFKQILLSIPVWASIINHMGKGCIFYSVYLYSVQFFMKVFKMNLEAYLFLGQVCSYSILGLSTVASGILCDVFINKDLMDITTSRKIFANFGAIGSTVYLVTVSLAGCHQLQAYFLFMIVVAFYGVYDIGVSANDIDISPNYAGTLKGLCRVGESLAMLILPLLLNKLTKDNTMQGWRNLFFVVFLVVLTSNMIFTIFGRAREQPWNLSQISTE